MGVFSKKVKVDPAELAAMREELQSVRSRLDAADLAKEMLEAHVRMLNETAKILTTRANTVDGLTARFGEVDDLKLQVGQIEGLKTQVAKIDAINSRLAALDGVTARLAALDGVNAKLAALDGLRETIDGLSGQVTSSATDARSAKEQIVSLNERVSNISTELANQLTELSTDMDRLGSKPLTAPAVIVGDQTATEEMIEELHEAQVRLAAEQARYEIAFRQDLATLAAQVKRPRT